MYLRISTVKINAQQIVRPVSDNIWGTAVIILQVYRYHQINVLKSLIQWRSAFTDPL